jgi:predicted ribosomally synthesized peptide with SipW-like signal peptide
MQRLLLSLAVIVAVGGAAAASTGAFFSDTETSTGNTFTAGSIDLTVDSTQHYNNAICVLNNDRVGTWQLAPNATVQPDQYPIIGSTCNGSWAATNLGPTNQFFNFSDVKPADQGENTVSMHLTTNPAWACADVSLTGNADNGINGPEAAAGDTTDGPFAGELAQNLSVFIWNDNATTGGATAGDNIYQTGEKILTAPEKLSVLLGGNVNGPATTSIALADATTGTGPLGAGSSSNIGIEWCAGTFTGTPGTPGFTCDGSTMGNNTQTDSLTADITMRVSQSRNQPNFTCSTGTTAGPQTIVVNANSLGNGTGTGWYFYDDTSNIVNNAIGSFVSGPSTPPLGTGSAQATATTSGSRVLLANSSFAGTPLSNISALSFSDYSNSGAWSATEVPFFRFDVDFTGSTVAYSGSLVYEPNDNTPAVTQNTWQSWNMISGGNAKWEYSRSFWPAGVTTVANTIPGTTARTWSSILADYPSIKMWSTGQLGMRVGEPGPVGFTANLDNFQINTGSGLKTYDFGN